MKLLFVLSVHGARQCDTLTKRSGIRTNSTVSKQKTLILLSTVRLMEFFSLSSKLITAVMVKSHHTRYGLVSITNSTFFVCYSSHLAFEYYFAVAWCFFFHSPEKTLSNSSMSASFGLHESHARSDILEWIFFNCCIHSRILKDK